MTFNKTSWRCWGTLIKIVSRFGGKCIYTMHADTSSLFEGFLQTCVYYSGSGVLNFHSCQVVFFLQALVCFVVAAIFSAGILVGHFAVPSTSKTALEPVAHQTLQLELFVV